METPEGKLLFRHFSHEHPLELTNSPTSENITCYGCKLNIFSENGYYKCKTCPFSLHQVCYNMPKSIQHKADPNHSLSLLVASSSQGTSNCKACGQSVIGFYYFCSKCGDHYHMSCSSVPPFVTIPSHPHSITLEFSPPYDFECDLCNKPGYSGWLYRCGLCDFDAHLFCVFSNQKAQLHRHQSFPLPDTTTRQGQHKTTSALPSATGTMNSSCVDVTSSCPRKQSPLPSTPLSDMSAMHSYQLSDAYFSIDFAKTNPSDDDDNMNQACMKASPHNKWSFLDYDGPNRQNEPSIDHHNRGPGNRWNGAITTGVDAHIWKELGQENKREEETKFTHMLEFKDQRNGSDSARSGCSCWSKLLLYFFK